MIGPIRRPQWKKILFAYPLANYLAYPRDPCWLDQVYPWRQSAFLNPKHITGCWQPRWMNETVKLGHWDAIFLRFRGSKIKLFSPAPTMGRRRKIVNETIFLAWKQCPFYDFVAPTPKNWRWGALHNSRIQLSLVLMCSVYFSPVQTIVLN